MFQSKVEAESVFQSCAADPTRECDFGAAPVVEFDEVEEVEGKVSVFQCTNCGHGVTRPPMPDVSVLYEGRGTQDYQSQDGGLATTIKRTSFDRQARAIVAESGFEGGLAADFGCGSGLLSSSIAKALPKGSRMVALDFFDEAPGLLQNADYLPFSRVDELKGKLDILFCFHALEHDDDSQGFLEQLVSLVKPGGLLVIEVPNVEAYWSKFFGKNWDNWYLPYHRVHFSSRSLRAVLERGGLEIMSEHAAHVPSFGRSFARMLGRENSLPFVLASAVLFPIQLIGEKLSGKPAAMRVVARRKA